MAQADFILEVKDGLLYVIAEVPYISCEKFPQITLNKNAVVTHMEINDHSEYQKYSSPDNDYFVNYTVTYRESGTIKVEYRTPVEGWLNQLSDDLIAISLYSAAFPASLPDYIQSSICYFKSGFEHYEIYDSYFDPDKGLYCKKTNKLFGEIANILAFRKGTMNSFELENIRVFYRNENAYRNLYECVQIGVKAYHYYNELYPSRPMKSLDLFVLASGHHSAYNRGKLIVMGESPEEFFMPEFREPLKYELLSHEMGHIWFYKASVDTYEDWLNETGAEWSSLLFLLHIGRTDIFDFYIRYHYKTYQEHGELIQPDDFHHPEFVHCAGVVLFHLIYQKYGEPAIIRLLQILCRMENPNTEDYISAIQNEFSTEIAEFIKIHLKRKLIS